MKVLSLFDGMACGMLAFSKLNIPIERYVAYEIDKYAVATSSHNFPMIEHKGDVFAGDFTDYKGFDFLIGGSPCTYWSIAQKNNRETEASGMGWELFSQYVRALKEAQPKYFVYENNKSMSKAIRQSITDTFGFEPICINSALVSAQNRQRLYWVGKRNADGTYSKVRIEQPQDKGILLKDIIENGEDLTSNDKSYCLTARYYKAGENPFSDFGSEKARPRVAVCVAQEDTGKRNVKGDGLISQYYEAREDGKTNTLTTVQKDNNVAEPVNTTADGKSQTIKAQYQQTSARNICCYTSTFGASGVAEPIRVGALPRPNGELSTSQAFRIYCIEGKSVNINASGGGAGGKTGLYAVPTNKQVYEVKDGQITIKGKQYPIKLADGFYIIRKLTVRECMRLQTVPEWYEFPVSNSQAYKMLGNGWTVDVIAHILRGMENEM